MNEAASHPLKLILAVLLLLTASSAAQQLSTGDLEAARAAYLQGNNAEAERILTGVLPHQPEDLGAIVLMAAVLDAAQRYPEAGTYFERALRIAPASTQVLSNFGNHYLSVGDRIHAREMYRRALAQDPRHLNANLQLAQLSVEDREGNSALAYLDRVRVMTGSDPVVLLLRARAFAICGRCLEAREILQRLEPDQASLQFSAGMALAECRLYSEAEESFSRALASDPRNFEILYNLGLAALRSGHQERAQSALETALKERPADPDALFALAQVFLNRGLPAESAALLAKARRTSPGRADIALLLAQVLARSELYQDSAVAYTGYLNLRPNDDAARRERGFAWACDHDFSAARSDLEWYLARHPADGIAYFELAVAEIFEDRPRALSLLTEAIRVDPKLYRARYARGLLNLEDGKARDAIADLEFYLAKEPKSVRAMVYLAETYLVAARPRDAADLLARAKRIVPDSTLVLVNYRRALERLGRTDSAAAVSAELNQARSSDTDSLSLTDLANYLDLGPLNRDAAHLAVLRESSLADPENVQLKIALAAELLHQAKKSEALSLFDGLRPASLNPNQRAECGRILLDFALFDKAEPYLDSALAANPNASAVRLDVSIAVFHSRGPDAALAELDKTTAADRSGDYYLLRAEILDAQGKVSEAAEALNQGMRAAPARASLYYEAVSFLLKHKLYLEANTLLEQASRVLPGDRELQLAQVVTLYMLRRNPDAEQLLGRMQVRWPEWDRLYLLKGILLEIGLKSAQALQALDMAIGLGAKTPEAYYYKALAITHLPPVDLNAANDAITRALTPESKDPYLFLLAGKISLERKEYAVAVERLRQAIRLDDTLIPAHYALRHAYSSLGDERKSAAEMEIIGHLAKDRGALDEGPFSSQDFLFAVRRPE